MKFKVTMKDPDTLSDAITEAVEADLKKIEALDAGDREALFEKRHQAISKIAAQWFQYGEYLSVEIDTDAKTATVVPVR